MNQFEKSLIITNKDFDEMVSYAVLFDNGYDDGEIKVLKEDKK